MKNLLFDFIQTIVLDEHHKMSSKYLSEISDNDYKKIVPNTRYIMSEEKEIHFRNVELQKVGNKPKGLWYGVGTEWIDWVKFNMPEYEEENLFEINIDKSNILLLKTEKEVVNFSKRYKSTKYYSQQIDWQAVSDKYSGIEISPYQHSLRLTEDWYYGWDVASGCIWNRSGIISIKRISEDFIGE